MSRWFSTFSNTSINIWRDCGIFNYCLAVSLQDIKSKMLANKLPLVEALASALPLLRGKISDEKLLWLASELQGYGNALDFYNNKDHGLPKYRIVSGTLKLMTANGELTDLQHPLASRKTFFLAAPLAWLEEFAKLPGDPATVESAELTAYMGRLSGTVVCRCPRAELLAILTNFKKEFVALIDEVIPAP